MTTRIVTPRNNPYSHKPCPRCYQPMHAYTLNHRKGRPGHACMNDHCSGLGVFIPDKVF